MQYKEIKNILIQKVTGYKFEFRKKKTVIEIIYEGVILLKNPT